MRRSQCLDIAWVGWGWGGGANIFDSDDGLYISSLSDTVPLCIVFFNKILFIVYHKTFLSLLQNLSCYTCMKEFQNVAF